MSPQDIREAHHAAAVRMAKFDRQHPIIRAILRDAPVNIFVPSRPLTIKQAKTLAKGARRA